MTSKEKLSVKYPIVTVMKQQMKQRDCFNANHVKGFDRRVRNHDLMMFLIEYAQKLSDENDKLKSGNTATESKAVEFKMTKYYDYADDWETDQERISHYYSRCGEAEQLCARMYNHNYNCLPGKNDKNVADLMDVYTDWCDYEYDELSSCLEKEPTRAEEDQLQIRHRNMLKSQLLHMTKRPD